MCKEAVHADGRTRLFATTYASMFIKNHFTEAWNTCSPAGRAICSVGACDRVVSDKEARNFERSLYSENIMNKVAGAFSFQQACSADQIFSSECSPQVAAYHNNAFLLSRCRCISALLQPC